MDLVSIIIPVYNKEKYIKDTIESVLNQTYSNFELILVNDGSTDLSTKIIERYEDEYPQIKVIHQRNEGVASARNNGIKHSNGIFICFLDADDLLDKNFLLKMREGVSDKNVAFCNHYSLLGGNKKENRMNYKYGNVLIDYMKNKCTPNTNSWIIRKAFIEKHQIQFPTEKKWGEDMMFFLKVLCHSREETVFVNQPLTFYRRNILGSLSEEDIDKVYEDISWLLEAKEYICNNYIVDKRRKQKVISVIMNYRIPATIIYRLYRNKKNISKTKYYNIKKELKPYINSFRFNNGIRSAKLLIYKMLI